MKKKLMLMALLTMTVVVAEAKDKSALATNLTPEQVEANYTQAIEGRTADILKVLALSDATKVAAVHDTIMAQYRALRAWHDTNDARLKAAVKDTNVVAQIRASLQAQHDAFIAQLSANLTSEQVEQVKDKMTYNKVQVTFAAYCEIIPTLTAAQKEQILAHLKAAREEAMDGGSAEEKSAIFKKYKGRIANYLSHEGVNEAQARKEWEAQRKAKAGAGIEAGAVGGIETGGRQAPR